MTSKQAVREVLVHDWHGPFEPELCDHAVDALEAGKVLVLPLPFALLPDEMPLLRADSLGGARKNISFDPASGKLGNAAVADADRAVLISMLRRYAESTSGLLRALLPPYARHLQAARTSFRPAEIAGRSYTPRHDDRLLHVDAFPSRPLHGRRILRVFTNVAPDGVERAWHVGEPFPVFAGRFLPRVKRKPPGHALALSLLGLTKGRRSAYDEIMLGLHDAGKLDAAYQANCDKCGVSFAPGTTWLCFTDQVLHAALSGRCALEQTFHLPVSAMAHPEQTPLRVLESLTGRRLV